MSIRTIKTFGFIAMIVLLGTWAVTAAAAVPAMDVTLCKSQNDNKPVNPTTQFSKDSAMIYATWKSSDVKLGQTVKAVWIAEDVGKETPPNYRIMEKEMKLKDPLGKLVTWWDGNFSLSKPTNGWPVGKYRLEIYVDGTLAKTLKFTIQ